MATILIADDAPAIRSVLTAILLEKGHRVIEATDGLQALVMVRADRPDMLITDVLMPVMNGYDLLKQLRLDPETQHLPVVFHTAAFGRREARNLAGSDADFYVLTKPSSTANVVAVVDRILSREPHREWASLPPTTDERLSDHVHLLSERGQDVVALSTANSRLRALINIGMEFASDRNSHSRLGGVCNAIHELFDVSYATLGVLDPTDGTVRFSFACGVEACDWVRIGEAPTGVLKKVVGDRRTVRAENPGGDPVSLGLSPGSAQVRAFVVAPIASPDRVYGWMSLVKNDGSGFDDADEEILKALGGVIGRTYQLEYETHHRVQADIRASDATVRSKLYLDTAEVMLLGLDTEGMITEINRKGCELLGWTEPELLGRSWIETFLPQREGKESPQQPHQMVEGVMTGPHSTVVTRSGEERRIEWHVTHLRDNAGVATGTLSCGKDVTLRYRAFDALKSAEEQIRFVLKSANVGMWEFDYRTCRVVWSDVAERQFGMEPGEFAGTAEAFIERIHPADREATVAAIESHRSGGDFTLAYRTLRRDGSIRWFNCVGRVHVDDQGEATTAVGVLLDITEQRAAEERNQQGQRMEAIGRLASGVAHDFNNLLTVILGFAELVARDDALAFNKYGDDLGEIIQAARRAAGLTSQLLAFSRQQVLHPVAIDLNGLIGEMTVMLRRLIGQQITVSLVLAPDLELVLADRSQIEQVVMNLVVNAKDAMPEGGKLTIVTENVEITDSLFVDEPMKAGRYTMLSFTDTGEGMSPVTRQRLFEPFYTTKERGKGTGLGLSTTYGIVQQSNGYIWVHSELGQGATFRVYLPCAESDETAGRARQTAV